MSDCFVLYLLLTCMKKKTSGADKFTNNKVRKQIKETRDLLDRIQRFQKTVPKGSLIITHKQKKIYYKWQYHDENLKYIRKYL